MLSKKDIISEFESEPKLTPWDAELTKTEWHYLKVKYTDYMSLTNNMSKIPVNSFEEFIIRANADKLEPHLEFKE